MEGHEPTSEETVEESFSPGWFAKFPSAMSHTPGDYAPTSEAPFAGKATRFDDARKDRDGRERADATTPGPIELP
jgi:hypothetical protein